MNAVDPEPFLALFVSGLIAVLLAVVLVRAHRRRRVGIGLGLLAVTALALSPLAATSQPITSSQQGAVSALASAPGGAVTTAKPDPDDPDKYKKKADKVKEKAEKRITQKDREAAAARALQEGALNPLMVEAAAAPLIDGAPHYFSHPNYANSPLPELEGATAPVGNPLQDRTYATDYPVGVGLLAPVFVVLPQELPDGLLTSFETWNQAAAGQSPVPFCRQRLPRLRAPADREPRRVHGRLRQWAAHRAGSPGPCRQHVGDLRGGPPACAGG